MKKIITITIFCLITGLLASSCYSKETRPVTPRPTPVVVDSVYCAEAEANLKKLHCIPENEPYTKKGKSFNQFCQEKQAQGVFLNPKCLAREITEKTGCSYQDVCTGTVEKK